LSQSTAASTKIETAPKRTLPDGLRDGDVRGLQSLRIFDHIELHLRAFLQRPEVEGLDRAEVHEPSTGKLFRGIYSLLKGEQARIRRIVRMVLRKALFVPMLQQH
jgi:hypothetical protein